MSEPLKVSSAEFQKHFGRYQDVALTQPVSVTRNGRERVVMISADEYRRLKRRDRQALLAEELSEAEVDAIRKAEVPSQYAYLDAEVKDLDL